MQKEIPLFLTPEQAGDPIELKRIALKALSADNETEAYVQVVRKSIDARGRFPKINVTVRVFIGEKPTTQHTHQFRYENVSQKEPVILVGSGPAGLFAALRLIELGLRPIILERGKDISERKKDIALLNRNAAFNADSNYCFGEGGAGTFSDGKLYTRSKKRGETSRILEIFHLHGAQDEILYEAHPHIGTDKLPTVIKAMRKTITDCGGEILFGTKVTDIHIENGAVSGIVLHDGTTLKAKAIVLATGHSARDMYDLLQQKGIAIEAKGFALGVRVEHPQELIDQIQYHSKTRNAHLPAASYNLVQQVDGRGVYSFCMCPGGHIVPAATAEKEIVVNGMSSSLRNSPFANSGIVVEIHPEDLREQASYGELCGLQFQRETEQLAFVNNGGGLQTAPAQRLTDFVRGKVSNTLPDCSYLPGVISSPMHFWLPDIIGKRLQNGFKAFDKRMKGFLTNEAIIVGVESRSSSPIRIPRDENSQHIQVKGLFPCGEGSGYAGGITSSAMDGEHTAQMVRNFMS